MAPKVALSHAGLVYKKGKFSATEDAQLNAAIERYRVVSTICYCGGEICPNRLPLQARGLSPADLDQIIFSNKLGKEKGHESFWSEISKRPPEQ